MLDILVGEPFAAGALGQTNTFPEGSIVSFAVDCVQVLHRSTACDAYWHASLEWRQQ